MMKNNKILDFILSIDINLDLAEQYDIDNNNKCYLLKN